MANYLKKHIPYLKKKKKKKKAFPKKELAKSNGKITLLQ